MRDIEPYISTFVEQQFPDFYRDEGPLFVAFVKAYYEWMEQANSVLYEARRIPSYRDIDTTTEEFIVNFKEKYLPNIQFETESNKRLFIKNALDFHRSKGSKRSVDLFFKLIYGIPASVYYPGDDLFKLSSGKWVLPQYLEVTPSTKNQNFIGRQVTGVISGATAFVDNLVVKRAKDKYIHVMYISSVSGNFETGELIAYDTDYDNNPTVVGSLTEFEIVSGGSDFTVGETVNFISNNGAFGKALVTEIDSLTGFVDFSLSDGGFGYNSNSTVIVSNNVLTIANVANLSYSLFETVTQPLANVSFQNANATIANNVSVFRYYANGSLAGSGKVIYSTQSGANGTLLVAVQSGNIALGAANLYVGANTIWCNTIAYTDKTATGNVMAISSNVTLLTDTSTGSFTVGEIVSTSGNVGIGVVKTVTADGSNLIVSMTNTSGIFMSGQTVTGSTSGKTAIARTTTQKIGIKSRVNTFYPNANNVTSAGLSGTNGHIISVSAGSGAGFSLGANSLFSFVQSINVNSDTISDYTAKLFNAATYGFPAFPSGNLTSGTIAQMLAYTNKSYGTVTNNAIIGMNPGSDYSEDPFVVIYEPETYQMGMKDYGIAISGATGLFTVGEAIRQSNSTGGLVVNGAIGQIKASNTSFLSVKRLSVTNSFSATVSGNNYVVGSSSNTVALVTDVSVNNQSNSIGINAILLGDALATNGSIANLQVLSSGFGYIEDEVVSFYKSDDLTQSGTVKLKLGTQGIGLGYYRSTGGFLSADKYLYDGEYYQEYSYEIMTKLPFERYADMIKRVIHVAGTKVFGSYVEDQEVSANVDFLQTKLSYSYANSPGTVSVNTSVSNCTGTSTTFTSLFANGDTIRILTSPTAYVDKRIVQVVNNTLMILSGPFPSTNTSANFSRINTPI